MPWIAHSTGPIDLGWDFLPTVEEVASQIAEHEANSEVEEHARPPYLFASFIADFNAAKAAATAEGWDGDFKSYALPRVIFLPDEGQFIYGFVWKQANNGTTYVVTRHKLAWL